MSEPKSTVVALVPPLPKGRDLSAEHREHLRGSGLSDVTIGAAQVYTETTASKVAEILRWSKWDRGTALVFPFFMPGRAEPVMYRVRPERPLSARREGKTVVRKYEQPKGVPVLPFYPPNTRRGGWLADTSRPMLWVEGEKKALALDQLGHATIGGTGVWAFHDVARRDAEDLWAIHPAILEHANLAGREHRIIFDSDAATNDQVMLAAQRLAGMLEAAGAARVLFIRIPVEGDEKLGIDDYLVKHGEAATQALLEQGAPIVGLPPEDAWTPLSALRALKDAPLGKGLRMPSGYTIDRVGAVWRKAERETGEDKLITRAPILIRRIVLDLYTGEERVELVFRRKGTWRKLLVDRRAMCEARALIAAAAAYGAPIEGSTAAGIVTWLSELEHVNERRIPRTTCVSSCGWHSLDGGDAAPVFMAPDLVEHEREIVFDDRMGRATVAGLGTKGDADTHLQALRDIVEQSTAAAVVVFASLAAPALKRLDAPNFAVHLFGDSSRGKSTMLRAAASIFGDPFDHAWVASWNSTQVGLETRAHILSDLPFCVDEAGVAEDRARTAAVYMLVNGVGRARGQKDGGLRSMLGWRTTVLSTGERELVADDANTGAQIRVLQCPVDGVGSWGATEVEAFNAAVASHHGHVGARWLQGLQDLSDEDWSALRATSRKLASEIAALGGGGGGIRARQAAYIAVLMVTERLAHQLLGLGDEIGAMTCALADQDSRDTPEVESAAERAFSEISGWLAATLRTGFARIGDGEVHDSHVRSEVMGYYRDEGRPDKPRQLWVLPRALKRVLGEHGHDMSLLREWRQRGWIDAQPKRYDRPQRVGGRLVRVICLDPESFWGPVLPLSTGNYRDD